MANADKQRRCSAWGEFLSQRLPPSHDVAMPLPSVPAAKMWITILAGLHRSLSKPLSEELL